MNREMIVLSAYKMISNCAGVNLLLHPSWWPDLKDTAYPWYFLVQTRDFWPLFPMATWPVILPLRLFLLVLKYMLMLVFDKMKGTDAAVFNSHSKTYSHFPYNAWQQQATVWSWQFQRCRCHLAWDCSPCRTHSNPAEAGSFHLPLARHALARIRYSSLKSWVWWCKVPATQLHHKMLLAQPVIIEIVLFSVSGHDSL
jgi:hypothetical protein